ncbi:hypothetical protein STEG23_004588, partial [Scotinomys teguina]
AFGISPSTMEALMTQSAPHMYRQTFEFSVDSCGHWTFSNLKLEGQLEPHSDISGGKPLEVEMAGIEYMNDDPGMVDVLYAKVHMKDGSNRLQELVDRVLERFQALGLTVKDWSSVKLHATVMNTLLRKDPNAEGRYNLYTVDGKYIFKERESFDGRNILKTFENFYFGSLKLNSIHISQRFTVDSFGNYASCGQVDFS